MRLLDRYVLRNFLEPFFLCFTGFIAIWLIIDLADNFNDFIEAHASFRTIFEYYVTQVPQTVILGDAGGADARAALRAQPDVAAE